MLSGMFLEELQTAFAEEWEHITGASLTAIPCFIPWEFLVIPPIASGCYHVYFWRNHRWHLPKSVKVSHEQHWQQFPVSLPVYLVIPCLLTTSLKMLSGIFLEELQTAFAEEWENITGASLTARVSRAVWIELCDRSTIIPNRFISSTTVWKRKKNKYIIYSVQPNSGLSFCFGISYIFMSLCI